MNLTEEEWVLVAPVVPPCRRGGRKRTINVREVLNGIMYVLVTGCQWRSVPKDLPPRSTLFDYLDLWNRDGTLEHIYQELYVESGDTVGSREQPDGTSRRHPKRQSR